jgi:hypothetical protein
VPYPKRPRRSLTAAEVGLKAGFRSGLEDTVAAQLQAFGIPYEYETLTLPYQPKLATYRPDFVLRNGIIVETKGRFVTADRSKHKLIKLQHPDLDIRFVFSNSRTRISKQSQTTYGQWAEYSGFQYADRTIPRVWLEEPLNIKSLRAIERLRLASGRKK